MIICQKANATAHCVLESGKKCIVGEALLAQHDVKKTYVSLCVLGGVVSLFNTHMGDNN